MLAEDDFIFPQVLLISNVSLRLPDCQLILKEFFCCSFQSLFFDRPRTVALLENTPWYKDIIVNLGQILFEHTLTTIALQQKPIVIIFVLFLLVQVR